MPDGAQSGYAEDVPDKAHPQWEGWMQKWIVRSGEDFGRAIAGLRRARGLTQRELAEQGGLSRPWLAKLESGRSTPVLDHLLRLTRRLGATVSITFDGGDGPA